MAQAPGGSRGSTGTRNEEFPGDSPAPASGTYETVNLFGRRTGHRVTVGQGEPLPVLPRGFAWVRVPPDAPAGD
ncbi:MAG TPA: hypothetical protein VME47_06970 [Acetobacteraceae bacterium]|nr:hypothetical protein [Acetobacteraceae bacterium]